MIPPLLLLAACARMIAPAPADSELLFEDVNNFVWSGSLAVGETDVTAGADFTLDWSALTVDLEGAPFDGVVDVVQLFRFELARADFEAGLLRGDLTSVDWEFMFFAHWPSATDRSMEASQLNILDNPIEMEQFRSDDPARSWGIVLIREDVLRSIHYVNPLDASANVQVALQDGDSALTSTVDLHSMPPIEAVAGAGPYTLDWSGLTLTGLGDPLDARLVQELFVARMDVPTPTDAEPFVTQLDAEAAELYRVDVSGTSVALDLAVDDGGRAFPGFTTSGVWLVGLRCPDCLGPAPFAMAVVNVN